jgi:hypothetical protein
MKRLISAFILTTAFALLIMGGSPALAAEPAHLSKQQVKEMIATAKTPAEHQQLAAFYRAEASQLEAEAKDHQELAAAYRHSPDAKHPMSGKTAEHCDYFAKSVLKAAQAAKQMAADYETMAKNAAK